jgi:hypothetical protein
MGKKHQPGTPNALGWFVNRSQNIAPELSDSPAPSVGNTSGSHAYPGLPGGTPASLSRRPGPRHRKLQGGALFSRSQTATLAMCTRIRWALRRHERPGSIQG